MENINQNNDLKVGDENPVNRTSTKISKKNKLQIVIDSIAYNKTCGTSSLIKEWARDISYELRNKRLEINISREIAEEMFNKEAN